MAKRAPQKIIFYRQTGSDSVWVEWTYKNWTDMIKKNNVYTKTKKDRKKKGTKKFCDAIERTTIRLYYAVSGSGTWYLDKTITVAGKTRTTKDELWTPPSSAVNLRAVVSPTSKTYSACGKNKKKTTAKWFDGGSLGVNYGAFNEYPSTPSIGEFTITNTFDAQKNPHTNLRAVVTYNNEVNDIYRVNLQILKDGTAIKENIYNNATSSEEAIGTVIFTKDILRHGTGSYQVRARVSSLNNRTELWSPYSAWSSSIDTKPDAPKNVKCECVGDDKVKVSWDKVANITQYQIEYVADTEDDFNGSNVSSTTADNVTSFIVSGLETGKLWFFQVRSVNGSDKSDPSTPPVSIVLATKPSPPTTWSSATNTVITNDIATTEDVFLYWVHNAQDGSAQRSAKFEFIISGITYYLEKENTETDDWGELVDKISELNLWKQEVYSDKSNLVSAGTIYELFLTGTGDTIQWKACTKGIHKDYSDWSMERIIKAYQKPNIELTVTDGNDNPLELDILKSFPLKAKGHTTPSSQKPISYYLSIVSGDSYNTTNTLGDEVSITKGTEIYTKYIDTNDQLDVLITASDVDFKSEKLYTLCVVVYMDSGLSAEASYSFTPIWIETGSEPELLVDYNSDYRFTELTPYCEYFVGYEAADNEVTTQEENYEPISYIGTAMTGTSVDGISFPSSGIENAMVGDMYFNKETYAVYLCIVKGNAETSKWSYRTTFDYGSAVSWYSGTSIDGDGEDDTYPNSGVTNAELNDHYFNTETGSVYNCVRAGDPSMAMWEYLWNIYWQVSPNIVLSIYRKEANGTYVTIAEGIDNKYQSSDSAITVRDYHPSFNECTYRVVSTDTENGAIGFTDVTEEFDESSVIVQWDEKWIDETAIGEEMTEEETNQEDVIFEGSILELPANIKLSDSNSKDVTLAEYIGRMRPVSYYGTQRGESASINCEFPKEDTKTLTLLRRLMAYQGDVYVREPSGLGYWANITVSYNRNSKELTIPVSISITPVEGGI